MKNKGFTLVELLVVISIIGVLAAIIIASLGIAQTKAKDAAVMSALSSYRSEIELQFPTGDYTNLCTSDHYLDMSAYVAEKGGVIDVCDADATDYILIATLPGGNQASTIFDSETAFAQQQARIFSGDSLFCINAKGTAEKITAAEFENMLTYASGLTDSNFNTNIISPYCSLTELQVDLGIIEEGETALNLTDFQLSCPAMAAFGIPPQLLTTGCMGADVEYMQELIQGGMDQMQATLQSVEAVDPSFCEDVVPDPGFAQICGGGTPNYEYYRTCSETEDWYVGGGWYNEGGAWNDSYGAFPGDVCVQVDDNLFQMTLMTLFQEYINNNGSQPDLNEAEGIALMRQAYQTAGTVVPNSQCNHIQSCMYDINPGEQPVRFCYADYVITSNGTIPSNSYLGYDCGVYTQQDYEDSVADNLEWYYNTQGYYPTEGTTEYSEWILARSYWDASREHLNSTCSSLPTCP